MLSSQICTISRHAFFQQDLVYIMYDVVCLSDFLLMCPSYIVLLSTSARLFVTLMYNSTDGCHTETITRTPMAQFSPALDAEAQILRVMHTV